MDLNPLRPHLGETIVASAIRKTTIDGIDDIRVLSLSFAFQEKLLCEIVERHCSGSNLIAEKLIRLCASDFVDIYGDQVDTVDPYAECLDEFEPDYIGPQSIEGFASKAAFRRLLKMANSKFEDSDSGHDSGSNDGVHSDDSSYPISWPYDSEHGLASELRWASTSEAAEQAEDDRDLEDPMHVMETVEHSEAAALRDEDLLDEFADHEWAMHIESRLHGLHTSPDDRPKQEEVAESVYLLRLGTPRHGTLLLDSLCGSPHLSRYCSALGKNSQHDSGALLLVFPYQLQDVHRYLWEVELHPFHVVVTESLEPLLQAALAEIPSRQRPRTKKGFRLDIYSKAHESENHTMEVNRSTKGSGAADSHAFSQDPTDDVTEHSQIWVMLVEQRSFLCVAPELRTSNSVVQSTTEATEPQSKHHYAYYRGVNPRRYLA